ncbi:MAG: endonuclease/exonuclease/phosphatase family protein, partial [Planctomycetota bacterium]
EAVRPEQTVRVAVVNAHGDSGDEAKLRALLERDDLDAIALLETPFWLVGELKAGAWRSRYPQHWLSDAANTGFPVLLTKWRQHEIETLSEGAHRVAKPPGHETILARPGGAFGLTVFHPRSPRSPARWRLAHELVDLVIARQREHIVDRGIPMVLMGDLNSPPSALHSRRVTGALDGRRAKPLLAATGTFPTMLPWPARVAIDDVIVGAGVRVVGWETADVGSDHKAVIVTLEVPLGRGPSLRSD